MRNHVVLITLALAMLVVGCSEKGLSNDSGLTLETYERFGLSFRHPGEVTVREFEGFPATTDVGILVGLPKSSGASGVLGFSLSWSRHRPSVGINERLNDTLGAEEATRRIEFPGRDIRLQPDSVVTREANGNDTAYAYWRLMRDGLFDSHGVSAVVLCGSRLRDVSITIGHWEGTRVTRDQLERQLHQIVDSFHC